MRLELKGLMTKCERIRDEHRGQWEEGLAKLVLAQKNQIAELTDGTRGSGGARPSRSVQLSSRLSSRCR